MTKPILIVCAGFTLGLAIFGCLDMLRGGKVDVDVPVTATADLKTQIAGLAAQIENLNIALGVQLGSVDSSTRTVVAGRDVIESEVAKELGRQLAKESFWNRWQATIQAGIWILIYMIAKRWAWFRRISDAVSGRVPVVTPKVVMANPEDVAEISKGLPSKGASL